MTVYNVTPEDKLNHLSTLSVEEPVRSLSADGGIICAALRTKYIILDCDHGQEQDLFPFDKEGFTPFICRVAKVC